MEEAEELDRKFERSVSKKRLESFKEYLKKAEYINPQSRVNALRKKLNNLPKTSSDETSDDNNDNDNNDSDDSEDNQISNFVDRVLKNVRKEIVNDDNKDDGDSKNNDNKKLLKLSKENADLKKKLNISLKANQKAKKNIARQLKASENLLHKKVSDDKKILELTKKNSELNAKARAKTDESVKKYLLRLKLEKKMIEKLMKHLKNITQKKHKGRPKK